MKTNRQKLGKKGEDMAVAFLENKGYQIIKRNFQAGQNEIDIIATDKHDLVFVEVKSVRVPDYGSAEFRVPLKKQRSIIRAAFTYLDRYQMKGDMGVRFDVICISLTNYPAGVANYMGAFWQERR